MSSCSRKRIAISFMPEYLRSCHLVFVHAPNNCIVFQISWTLKL
ncbi:hypothetical protein MtrunA17_Chr7g0216051 [Medicago truncatula]|uniref:Uncharacterized protein n=1 Tax=Medicago truncatula TaxID=3880 RepID=A0A396GXF9_MEDTR|nr:hypothetical protein MtrunA17_Chr7g0216051 [Medicago truncatula]